MGVTEVKGESRAGLCCSVTDAVDLEGLLEAVLHADDHVIEDSAARSVDGTALLLVVGTLDNDDVSVALEVENIGKLELKSSESSLYRDVVAFCDYYVHSGGNRYRISTYS